MAHGKKHHAYIGAALAILILGGAVFLGAHLLTTLRHPESRIEDSAQQQPFAEVVTQLSGDVKGTLRTELTQRFARTESLLTTIALSRTTQDTVLLFKGRMHTQGDTGYLAVDTFSGTGTLNRFSPLFENLAAWHRIEEPFDSRTLLPGGSLALMLLASNAVHVTESNDTLDTSALTFTGEAAGYAIHGTLTAHRDTLLPLAETITLTQDAFTVTASSTFTYGIPHQLKEPEADIGISLHLLTAALAELLYIPLPTK